MLTSRGLGRVLGDLASMGFDAEWGVLGAADLGAPHQRDRIWIVAHSKLHRVSQRRGTVASVSEIERSERVPSDVESRGEQQAGKVLAYAVREREQGIVTRGIGSEVRQEPGERSNRPRRNGVGRWPAEPGMGRVANGVANRVDRIKALGNGQVPRVAATAYRLLCTR